MRRWLIVSCATRRSKTTRDDGQQQDERGNQRRHRREDRMIDNPAFGPADRKAIGRGHRRVVHGAHGSAQDQRAITSWSAANRVRLSRRTSWRTCKRQDGQQERHDDGGREQDRIVADKGIDLEGGHAGVVHRRDAHPISVPPINRRPAPIVGRATTCRATPAARTAGTIDRAVIQGSYRGRYRQDMGEHADEMHRPDAAPHGAGPRRSAS